MKRQNIKSFLGLILLYYYSGNLRFLKQQNFVNNINQSLVVRLYEWNWAIWGVGQNYNLAKLFSLSLSQLSLIVEFLKKKFSVLGPRRQGWLGLKEAWYKCTFNSDIYCQYIKGESNNKFCPSPLQLWHYFDLILF